MAEQISYLTKKEEMKENNVDEVGGIYQVSIANYRSLPL